MSNKYHARKAEYGGSTYHSKKEAQYAAELDLLLRAGEIVGWRRQVRVPLEVNGEVVCRYVIDFVVEHKDGTKEYVEVKGYPTPLWKLKWKMFHAIYGKKRGVKITLVQ